jgi:hypothetical protein
MPRPTREQLIARQLIEYPDSRILTHSEALHWPYHDAAITAVDKKRAQDHWELIEDQVDVRDKWYFKALVMSEAEKFAAQRALSTARGLAVALSNGEDGVFYECGLQPDGTYRWRGYRFGLEGSEYQSGFGRF